MGHYPHAERAVLTSALRDFPILGAQLGDAIHPLRASGVGLAVGLLGLLCGALGVTQAGQLAMAEVWNVPGVVRPNFFTRLGRGLALFALLGIGLVLTTVLGSLPTFGGAAIVAKVVGGLVAIALNIGLYVLAFRVMTPRQIPTNELVPG